jgi:proteic killer suppression protein
MEVQFARAKLRRLDAERGFAGGLSPALVRAFRKTMQVIRAAEDERDLHAYRAARFEKLSGKRQHQHSMRLNDQYRLVVELQGSSPNKIVMVIDIEDYH